MQGTKPPSLQKHYYSLLHLSSTTNHLKQIHCRLLLLNLHQDQFLITNLVSLLSKRFSNIHYAVSIFNQTPNPTTFLSNSIIQAFSLSPNFQKQAFRVYTHQLTNPFDQTRRPNRFTFPPLLKSCVGAFNSITPLQELHSQMVRLGVCEDVYVGTSLIDSYAKCGGDIKFARRVFDEMPVKNVVTWNSMISGFGKSGEMGFARKLFDEMVEKNLVTWTTLISGYAQNGNFVETLNVFEEMGVAGVKPSQITLVSVLSACANLGALAMGRRIHSIVEDINCELDIFVGCALIDMYSKCGMVVDALRVFETIPTRNVVFYSAMIVGLAMNGRAEEAIKIFEDMQLEGILPNDITFVGVLCACCHAGLVEKGTSYFSSMTRVYSLIPKLQHYACMVDLLGRAGHLDQAFQFIKKMPIKPDVVIWGALLGTCKTDFEFKVGVYAAQKILELEPQHSGGLVFLSSACARVGDWDGIERVRQMMGSLGIKRTPGKSWMELNNVVHQFYAGDKSHPQNDRIYVKLDELDRLLEVEGYKRPLCSLVDDAFEKEEKEQYVSVHSEKLAIAFGLINTPEGTTLRIFKNLRVCDDCHSYIKLISRIVERDIVLRDNSRFHHFSSGICSCQDYW